MKSGNFSDEIFIKKPAAEVLAFQADLLQSTKMHPLIIKIEKRESKRPGISRYAITDRLKMGPFTFKIVYFAEAERIGDDTVRSEAWQKPGIHVTNLTRITPQEDGCLIHEESTIEAPNWAFSYVYQQAHDSHMQNLRNVKKYLEAL